MHLSIGEYLKASLCLCCFFTPLLSADNPTSASVEQQDMAKAKTDERLYYTFNYPQALPGGKTLLTGIRGVDGKPDQVYISGFYDDPNGVTVVPFVYKGTLMGKGSWNVLNYPSSSKKTVTATNLYGPNNGRSRSTIQVVGNYTTQQTGSAAIGCLYEGPLDGSGRWTTLIPSSAKPVLNTIAHSTMGGLVVGNYSTQSGVGRAFIYNIKHKKYYEIIKPKAKDITAYGIWHNGHHSYTICGGYSNLGVSSGVGSAYLVDWNDKTKKLSNWRTYAYNNDPVQAIVTHFDGITSDGRGGYNLTGDWIGVNQIVGEGFFCQIKHKHAKWSPVVCPNQLLTSGNSVYRKTVIGSYTAAQDGSVNGYISIPQRELY